MHTILCFPYAAICKLVHFFFPAKWLTGCSSKFTSGFGLVSDPQALTGSPGLSNQSQHWDSRPERFWLKNPPPRFELMILQMQLVDRNNDSAVQVRRLQWIPILSGRDPTPRKKSDLKRKQDTTDLITSVSLSNDCTAGDLHHDWSSPWMRALRLLAEKVLHLNNCLSYFRLSFF